MDNMYNVSKEDFPKTPASQCALEFIDYLVTRGLWQDTFVYADGKRYGNYNPATDHYLYDSTWDCVFCEDNMNPRRFFEFCGNFMSVSTEGPLYNLLNYGGAHSKKVMRDIEAIFNKYGKYYEFGDAWNFSLYDI